MQGTPDPEAREIALAGGEANGVREAIRRSWRQARQRGLRPDRYLPPLVFAEDQIGEIRREHPIAQAWHVLSASLRWASSEPGNLVFASDADGHLLWAEGRRADLRTAERVHLVPGALWNEAAAGTSGIGTALALRRPFQVHGFEHYLSVATGYTCTAAPIRHPTTGEVIGAVDLTSKGSGSPAIALALLATAARLAEAELRGVYLRRHAMLQDRFAERLALHSGTPHALVSAEGSVLRADPPGWLPARLPWKLDEGSSVLPTGQAVLAEQLSPGGPFLLIATKADEQPLVVRALGRDRARVRIGSMTRDLGGRHSELVVVLLANPGGLTAEELRREVYGPSGKAVTLRAEIARLRSVLGHRLASNPYRLTGEVRADFLDLDAGLESEAPGRLLDGYPGPLLPSSSAPGIVAFRERLQRRMRARLLSDGGTDSLLRWVTSHHGRGDRRVLDALDQRGTEPPRSLRTGHDGAV